MSVMAEETSPAAKRAKVDGEEASGATATASGEVNGGNGKIALVTGITGQVSVAARSLRRGLETYGRTYVYISLCSAH